MFIKLWKSSYFSLFLNCYVKPLLNIIGNPPVGSFRIPHKVVLLEDRDLACVADRENGRIQCFAMVTGRFRFQIQREEFGGTLYSIAYAQEKGNLLSLFVSGMHFHSLAIKVFLRGSFHCSRVYFRYLVHGFLIKTC